MFPSTLQPLVLVLLKLGLFLSAVQIPQYKGELHFHDSNSGDFLSFNKDHSTYEMIKRISKGTLNQVCEQLVKQFSPYNHAEASINKSARSVCEMDTWRNYGTSKAFNIYVNTTNGFFLSHDFEDIAYLTWIFTIRCDVKFPLNFCVMMKRDKTVNGELSFKFLREEICENDVLSKIESGPWASYLHTCADTNASPELTTSGITSLYAVTMLCKLLNVVLSFSLKT